MDHDDRARRVETSGALTPSQSHLHGGSAAGRARTGDFEIFSLALSQTELPRLARAMRTGEK